MTVERIHIGTLGNIPIEPVKWDLPFNHDKIFVQILVTEKLYLNPNINDDVWTTDTPSKYHEIEAGDLSLLLNYDGKSVSVDNWCFNHLGMEDMFVFNICCSLKEVTSESKPFPDRKELDAAIDEYAMAYQEAENRREYGNVSFLEAMKPVNKALAVVNKMLDQIYG